MGYSEDYCQICGVGFNIARIRKANHDSDGELEEPGSASWSYIGYGGADDFVEVDNRNSDIVTHCGPKSGCKYIDRDGSNYPASPWGDDPGQSNEDVIGNLPPSEAPHEHLAGPGCNSVQGYNGHNISVEEMQGCRVLQCLVPKDSNFTPAEDDQEFETLGTWFLSGIADGMQTAEMRFDCEVLPVRHNANSVNPWNTIMDFMDVEEIAIPFHPYCLEVYKRVAKLRRGDIDIAGLTGWYEKEADWDTFHGFPRDGPVKDLQEQWWDHVTGTEWVVANPLFMPRLAEVLKSSISTDPNFNHSNGAFNIPSESQENSTVEDPFSQLPRELQLLLLHELDSQSIASLRLVSRSFRQLPISLWHNLIEKEMPWLWEASSSTSFPYSFWADKTFKYFTEETYRPALYKPISVPNLLPPTNTNWYLLYLNIKQNWNELKGLRNRKRIWTDCEEIVCRIAKYRENGQIPVDDIK